MTRWIFLMLIVPAAAGALELGGSFEQSLQAYYDEDIHERLMHLSRLRLDFESGGGPDELSFRGNLKVIRRAGELSIDPAWVLPEQEAESWSQSWLPQSLDYEAEEIVLDNAWIGWRGESWRLRAGRQQLSWGPGYGYNPTDLFHRKDMIDPNYEKPGVLALRWDRWWGVSGQATVIVAPADEIEYSEMALRLAGHAAGFDPALTLHRVYDETFVDLSDPLAEPRRRGAAGLELSGEALGCGLWAEGNYNFMEEESDFHRLVLGIDHSTEGGSWLLLEALLNGRGSQLAPYAAEDWAAWLLHGEPLGAGWIMAGFRTYPTPLASVGLYGFAAVDGSFLVNPRLDFSVGQNAELTLFASAGLGYERGAFPPELFALTGRLTVWF